MRKHADGFQGLMQSPVLLNECSFVSFQLFIPSQVNWMHYELEPQLKSLLFWLHGKKK